MAFKLHYSLMCPKCKNVNTEKSPVLRDDFVFCSWCFHKLGEQITIKCDNCGKQSNSIHSVIMSETFDETGKKTEYGYLCAKCFNKDGKI